MASARYLSYNKYLCDLSNRLKFRKLKLLSQENKKSVLDFSSNDYLALSKDREIIEYAAQNLLKYGNGATGSRLLSGNNELAMQFEEQIALDKGTHAALLFATGFQANFSCLSALLDSKILGHQALVFFDKLNHASLYQAVFASQAELLRYRHNDMQHLAEMLEKYKNDKRAKFIVSETVFGMDGDVAPLQVLCDLARTNDCFLYLDEAHATGIFGKKGYGLATDCNLSGLEYLIMGTFSKALGGSGAYIACDNIIKDYLINRASGFIYSTAAAPATIAAAHKAWQKIAHMAEKRKFLLDNANILRQKLTNAGLDIGCSTTHIIPIILGDEEKTLHAQEELFQANILVSCIRPPTVPPNSSRLRIALTAYHSEADLEQLYNNLISILQP